MLQQCGQLEKYFAHHGKEFRRIFGGIGIPLLLPMPYLFDTFEISFRDVTICKSGKHLIRNRFVEDVRGTAIHAGKLVRFV